MTEEILAQYKDQESESSSLSDQDMMEAVMKTGIPENVLEEAKVKAESSIAPPSISFVGIGEAKKETEFKPYTFEPEQLLKDTKKEEEYVHEDILKDPLYELTSQYNEQPQLKSNTRPIKEAILSKENFYTKDTTTKPRQEPAIPSFSNYTKPASSYKPLPASKYKSPLDTSIMNEDPSVTRGTQDYKDFEKEFSKNKMSQKEIDVMTKRIDQRYKRLQEFVRELEGGDVDSLLFRNQLLRELGDIQNDLKEANSNVLVLMNDRATMKDAFCLLQIKLKKVNSLNKTFQEDINE